jgi:hypothetical protein
MGDARTVSVDEVVALLTRRRARLPFEIGAFVALEACERLVSQGPCVVQPGDVHIDDEGQIAVASRDASATSEQAARSVARVLARLLVAAGHGVPPVLLQLVEQGPEGADWDLVRLRDELEASLVPLNRAAARRVLARFLRDAQRAPAEPPPSVSEAGAQAPPPDDVDAELDRFLDDGAGDAPGRPAPQGGLPHGGMAPPEEAAPTPTTPSAPPGPDTTAAPTGEGPSAAATAEGPPAPPSPSTGPADHPARPSLPDSVIAGDAADLTDLPTGRGRAWVVALLVAALLGGLLVALAFVRPDIMDRLALRGAPADDTTDPAATRSAEERRLAEEDRQRFGHLTLHVEPARAQVLRYVGRGPATVDHLPIGVAHEFVAIADGRLPSRAVIPADAEWSSEGGGRYELAMQTGESSRHARELELGDSKLPREMGQATGTLGTVRVITTPPGAKVYHLIGFAPRVEAENLDTTRAHDLLIYREGHEPQRLIVGPSDWEPVEGRSVAEVTVKLEGRR